MEYDQVVQLVEEMSVRKNGKMGEPEADRIHFLIRRGADPVVVEEMFQENTLFDVHWSYLITDFTGLNK